MEDNRYPEEIKRDIRRHIVKSFCKSECRSRDTDRCNECPIKDIINETETK